MSNDEKRPEETDATESTAEDASPDSEGNRWTRPEEASADQETVAEEQAAAETDAHPQSSDAAGAYQASAEHSAEELADGDVQAGADAEAPTDLVRSEDDAPVEDSSEAAAEDPAEAQLETAADQESSEAGSGAGAGAGAGALAGAAVAAPAKSGGGRVLAALALLLALGAAGGAGYLYYELIYLQPFAKQYAPVETVNELARVEQSVTQNTQTEADLALRLDAVREELVQLDESQAARAAELASSVETAVGRVDRQLDEQKAALQATESQLMENLNEVANRAPPSRAEWKVAEVEYLLRIANHRVLMEKDADGGLQLLQTADAILAELDDFGFHQVRAQLAEEMLSLKRVGEVDAQGVYLRLEAVKRELDGLPLKVPELLTKGPSTTLAEDAGLWERILDQFTPYFAYRSELKTRIEPLLAPDEIAYLELNLRLMLEQAQLASLRAQQEIFEQSLDNAADWMKDYLNVDDPAVLQIVTELEQLRDTSVLRDLPDISGSLRSLLATERGTS